VDGAGLPAQASGAQPQGLDALREVVAASTTTRRYDPQSSQDRWNEAESRLRP